MRTSGRAIFLDASAIVAFHTDEANSEVLRAWLHQEPTQYSSPSCFFESLNIYKSKWKYRGQLTADGYRAACFNTFQWYRASMSYVKDIDFNNQNTFQEVHLLAMKHALDLSDAFQILSVRDGFFSSLAAESETILCTGDGRLAEVARIEGVKVWDFQKEKPPR